MANKIGILVIHGIGTGEIGFDEIFEKFKSDLGGRLKEKEIYWQGIFWAKEINAIENRYYKKLEKIDLNYMKLRDFMINSVGDETAYRKGNDNNKSIYDIVQNHIYEAIKNLYKTMGNEGELIIVSYSMSTIIISDYIWDIQTGKSSFVIDNEFEGMKKIKDLFTMGSTLPLFLFALDKLIPIEIEEKSWINFYDKDDILAYPIGIFDEYEKIVEDVPVNVGNFLTSWNPASHLGYFEGKEVLDKIAGFIRNEEKE